MLPDHFPKRVVSLQPSATVILQSIGKLDRLVACTKYCAEVCLEAGGGQCLIVSDSWTAHSEQIIAAGPDLVIAAVPYQEKAVVEILKAGARFLGLAPKSLSDIYTDIAAIAGIMGVPERSFEVITKMQDEIARTRLLTVNTKRPRVFCEEWGKPLIASQAWVAELVEAAGGEFIGTPGLQVSAEKVLEADPEILIAAWCGAGDRVPLDKIVRERGLQNTSAARNGRICCIRDEFLNTPAPTLVQGLQALAAAINPNRFSSAPGLRWIADQPSPQSGE